MEPLFVIKVGGNVIDDAAVLDQFLADFAAMKGNKILIHGGGKLATDLAAQLGIEQQMVDGRRITDKETLKVVTMVYAGLINKTIVAKLQAGHCTAMGICGADNNAIQAHKRINATIDYGFVGDVDTVNASFIDGALKQGTTLIVAPITHDGKGTLLNTNADTMAQEIAKAMSPYYKVQLVFSFDKPGVLLDKDDNSSVIPTIDKASFEQLKSTNKIVAGMIPKLENAFKALDQGIETVRLGRAQDLPKLIKGDAGTIIVHGK
jgi:acetylglutamate kinase